jgi:hypothetical protein
MADFRKKATSFKTAGISALRKGEKINQENDCGENFRRYYASPCPK